LLRDDYNDAHWPTPELTDSLTQELTSDYNLNTDLLQEVII